MTPALCQTTHYSLTVATICYRPKHISQDAVLCEQLSSELELKNLRYIEK